MLRTRLITLAVLAALTLGVWIYPQVVGQHTHAADETKWIAGVPGRSNLQLCVANHNGSPITGEIMRSLNTAFAKVKKHPEFERAGLNRGDGPHIRAGCPSASTLHTAKWGRNKVTTPGSIHTYVFIASEQELQGALFKSYPRVAGHESMCIEHVCSSVANAVYLTPQELSDPDLLVHTLTAAIGLAESQGSESIYSNGVEPDNKSQ